MIAWLKFSASRIPGGVVMADVTVVFLDRADDITLHDLHVVNIVEELEPFRAHALHELDAPSGVIAHVILVIHF